MGVGSSQVLNDSIIFIYDDGAVVKASEIEIIDGQPQIPHEALIEEITSNIINFTAIKRFVLSNHVVSSLPKEIGNLKNLVQLDLCFNKLSAVPDSLGSLKNLEKLDLSHNLIEFLPPSMGNLKKLWDLNVSHNKLTTLPPEMGCMDDLVSLQARNNQLHYLPGELTRLKFLQQIIVDCNPLLKGPYVEPNFPATLQELVGRWFVRHGIYYENEDIPASVKEYLGTARICSWCQGPYFQNCVTRVRMATLGDHVQPLPLANHMCINHWENNDQRLTSMFQIKPFTSPSSLRKAATSNTTTTPSLSTSTTKPSSSSSSSSLLSSSLASTSALRKTFSSPSSESKSSKMNRHSNGSSDKKSRNTSSKDIEKEMSPSPMMTSPLVTRRLERTSLSDLLSPPQSPTTKKKSPLLRLRLSTNNNNNNNNNSNKNKEKRKSSKNSNNSNNNSAELMTQSCTEFSTTLLLNNSNSIDTDNNQQLSDLFANELSSTNQTDDKVRRALPF